MDSNTTKNSTKTEVRFIVLHIRSYSDAPKRTYHTRYVADSLTSIETANTHSKATPNPMSWNIMFYQRKPQNATATPIFSEPLNSAYLKTIPVDVCRRREYKNGVVWRDGNKDESIGDFFHHFGLWAMITSVSADTMFAFNEIIILNSLSSLIVAVLFVIRLFLLQLSLLRHRQYLKNRLLSCS